MFKPHQVVKVINVNNALYGQLGTVKKVHAKAVSVEMHDKLKYLGNVNLAFSVNELALVDADDNEPKLGDK